MNLIQSCANCEAFDGDCFCSLPAKDRLISGHIVEAESVVCAKWEKRESDTHLELLEAFDKQTAEEGIAYENALYRLGGKY